MTKNQNNQISSNKSKKVAIISVILGSISFLGSLLDFFLSGEFSLYLYRPQACPLYFCIFIPLAILALILGIFARKSSKKLATIGIILSTIALLILLFWYFIYLGFYYGA